MGRHFSPEETDLDLTDALNRFRGPLTGLVASWGATAVDAAEIAQESFAEAWLNRENCRGDCSDAGVFGAWLNGVAKNRYRNWSRSQRTRESRVVPVDPATLQNATRDCPEPEDERLVRLREAVQRWPENQREVVLMHYLEETTVDNVAALLAVTPKTVEGRLYQARKALKRMMDEVSADESETNS